MEKKKKITACMRSVTYLERGDSGNLLSRFRLNLHDFSQIIYQIVPYARNSLSIKFIFKCYFKKPYLQLRQNVP